MCLHVFSRLTYDDEHYNNYRLPKCDVVYPGKFHEIFGGTHIFIPVCRESVSAYLVKYIAAAVRFLPTLLEEPVENILLQLADLRNFY